MTPSSALPLPFLHQCSLGRPACPRCGVMQIAAHATEFLSDGNIHHAWICDDCGQAFETLVKMRGK